MENGVTVLEIRRTNRNLFVLNALLIGSILLLLGGNWRYIYASLNGPYVMDRAAITGVQDPEILSNYFVRTPAGELLGTMFTKVTVRKNKHSGRVESETTDACFVAVKLGEKMLLVKSKTENPGKMLTGYLVVMPGDVSRSLKGQLTKLNAGDAAQRFLPFMIDTMDHGSGAYGLLAFGLPLLVLGLWNVKKVIERSANPESHPFARRLAAIGVPSAVMAAMDLDLADHPGGTGPLKIGRRWILNPGYLDCDAIHAHDILWVYKKVTQHYTNGVPTGKSFGIVIRGRGNTQIEVSVSEAVQDVVLRAVAERFPWLIMGFSDELEALWKTKNSEFVEAVEARRRACGDPDTATATKEAAHGSGPAVPAAQAAQAPSAREVRSEPVVLDPSEASCRYCSEKLMTRPMVVCPECQTPHHAECWTANASRCTVFGCKASLN